VHVVPEQLVVPCAFVQTAVQVLASAPESPADAASPPSPASLREESAEESLAEESPVAASPASGPTVWSAATSAEASTGGGFDAASPCKPESGRITSGPESEPPPPESELHPVPARDQRDPATTSTAACHARAPRPPIRMVAPLM
jgi:hypothetical protein